MLMHRAFSFEIEAMVVWSRRDNVTVPVRAGNVD